MEGISVMSGLNEATLIGNLCSDPEVRSMNNGGEVVNLRLATNESWKDKEGKRQDRSEFHSVVIFNENLGRVAKAYLRKGSKVFIRGAIQTRRWQDQSGNDKYTTEICLQKFRGELVLLDSKASSDEGGSKWGGDNASPFGGKAQTGSAGQSAFDSDLDDSEVPF